MLKIVPRAYIPEPMPLTAGVAPELPDAIDRNHIEIERRLKEPPPYVVQEGEDTGLVIDTTLRSYFLGAVSGVNEVRAFPEGRSGLAGVSSPERGYYRAFCSASWMPYGAGGTHWAYLQPFLLPGTVLHTVGQFGFSNFASGLQADICVQINEGDSLVWILSIAEFTLTSTFDVTWQFGLKQMDKGPPGPDYK